jgi:hypothetical protein
MGGRGGLKLGHAFEQLFQIIGSGQVLAGCSPHRQENPVQNSAHFFDGIGLGLSRKDDSFLVAAVFQAFADSLAQGVGRAEVGIAEQDQGTLVFQMLSCINQSGIGVTISDALLPGGQGEYRDLRMEGQPSHPFIPQNIISRGKWRFFIPLDNPSFLIGAVLAEIRTAARADDFSASQLSAALGAQLCSQSRA